jgi:hypothetical protein
MAVSSDHIGTRKTLRDNNKMCISFISATYVRNNLPHICKRCGVRAEKHVDRHVMSLNMSDLSDG